MTLALHAMGEVSVWQAVLLSTAGAVVMTLLVLGCFAAVELWRRWKAGSRK